MIKVFISTSGVIVSVISSSASFANDNSSITEAVVHFPLKPALTLVFSFTVSLSTKDCRLDKEFTLISEPLLSISPIRIFLVPA